MGAMNKCSKRIYYVCVSIVKTGVRKGNGCEVTANCNVYQGWKIGLGLRRAISNERLKEVNQFYLIYPASTAQDFTIYAIKIRV